jgi:methylmalonyl-CoA epimerase
MEWKFSQVGIVVRDLDKAIDYYSSVFGFGRFHKLEFPQLKVEIRGKPTKIDVKAALVSVGNFQLELIQAEPGESIYWEFFQNHGEGLHHLGFDVKDMETELAKIKEKGIGVLMYGRVGAGGFVYLEPTKPGGVIMEILQRG